MSFNIFSKIQTEGLEFGVKNMAARIYNLWCVDSSDWWWWGNGVGIYANKVVNKVSSECIGNRDD